MNNLTGNITTNAGALSGNVSNEQTVTGSVASGGSITGNVSQEAAVTGNVAQDGAITGSVTQEAALTGEILAQGPEVPGGTTSYPELDNKPQINGVELVGDKSAEDLGLQPAGDYALKNDIPAVPEKVSAFENDAGYLTEHQDLSDYAKKDELPNVPAWAMQDTKPAYTAAEVGADISGAAAEALTAANSNTGAQITAHNVATDAHNDLRIFIAELTERVNALADSDDTTLDQMSEIVAYIKNNRELVEQVTTEKVSVTDIIDNLTTNLSNKVLSASMGVYLKSLIDAIIVPTKVSAFENDAGYATTNAPTDISGEETITAKFKTSNGGSIAFGKQGANVGTMIRLDQVDGTARLLFRASERGGAMVWEQPEQGAQLFVDLGATGVDKKRITFPSKAGTLVVATELLDLLYPVGSVYMTNTNEAPAIGGEWELVGKGFREEQGNGTTALFTPNADNTDTCTVYYRRSGNTLWLKITLKTAVTVVDTTRQFGTLKLSALGITAFANQTMHQMSFGSENGIGLFNVTTAGALSSIDARPKANDATSIASGSTFYGQYTLPYMAEQMLDDFCDKFYWKRTA